jgi:hypothetical protein
MIKLTPRGCCTQDTQKRIYVNYERVQLSSNHAKTLCNGAIIDERGLSAAEIQETTFGSIRLQ